MKIARLTWIIAILGLASPAVHAATLHTDRTVYDIVSPDAARPCLFFRLAFVDHADPTSPSKIAPWFAIPVDAVGNVPSPKYQEISRMLYQAKATNAVVTVQTTGGIVPMCSNFVEVEYATMR
jgi:hypothetical protein